MPKRTNDFQQLVLLIEHAIQSPNTAVTESFEFRDPATSTPREVDIVIRRMNGSDPHYTCVECTDRTKGKKKRSDVEWVEQMWGKHQTLPTRRLILVSKGGFSSVAKKKAMWFGIETYDLAHAKALNWSSVVSKIRSIGVVSFQRPYLAKVTVIFDSRDQGKIKVNKEHLASSTLSVGDENIPLLDFVHKYLNNEQLIDEAEKKAFPNTTTGMKFEIPIKLGAPLIDAQGNNQGTVIAVRVWARCKKETRDLPLFQNMYRATAVAHGKSSSLGYPIDVVFAQRKNDSARAVLHIRGIKKAKPVKTP